MLLRMLCLLLLTSIAGATAPEEMPALAAVRAGDLRLSAYVTVDGIAELAASEEARATAQQYLSGLGITKVYLETYRGDTIADEASLIAARDFIQGLGMTASAGIATYPGGNVGVVSNEGLPWYNFQAPESQEVLLKVVRTSARVFDEVIIDDFLCSGDTSEISQKFKQNRSWPEYRRDLLTALSQRFIAAAEEENPDVVMIIKFPQWYDLFHVFGYDVVREPQLYDRVYVGTETRGANTQRYGFTQPYEGFINYRWLASLAGEKIGGAWFDHGDCDEHDFLDQAYQSVLAGAQELIFFSHNALREGHPGHQAFRDHFTHLANLAALVKEHPVEGVAAYKPPHSDAGTDIYVMDQIGMLGIPLVPVSAFPRDAAALFLPTQAAADATIVGSVQEWLAGGARRLVMTTGFLAASGDAPLTALAGLEAPVQLEPARTTTILAEGQPQELEAALGLAAKPVAAGAQVLLEAQVAGNAVPYLTSHTVEDDQVVVLNCETFSPADFQAVNEVLLSPRALGMLRLPETWLNVLRPALAGHWGEAFGAPARVTLQALRNHAALVIQNYRDEPAQVRLDLNALVGPEIAAALNPVAIEGMRVENGVYSAELPPRVHVILELPAIASEENP